MRGFNRYLPKEIRELQKLLFTQVKLNTGLKVLHVTCANKNVYQNDKRQNM